MGQAPRSGVSEDVRLEHRIDHLLAAGVYAAIALGLAYLGATLSHMRWAVWVAEPEVLSARGEVEQCLIIIEDFNSGFFADLDGRKVRECQERLGR